MTYLANAITLSRGLSGFFVVFFLSQGNNLAAFFLFIAAILTDMCDGFIARMGKASNPAGLWLDPFADRLLAGLTWIGLAQYTDLPWWLYSPILLRHAFIGIGWWLTRSRGIVFQPNFLGRLMIGFEGTALPFLLLDRVWCGVHWFSAGILLSIVVLCLSIFSAFQYLFELWQRASIRPRSVKDW